MAQKGSKYFENQQNQTWIQSHVGVIKNDVTRAQRSITTSYVEGLEKNVKNRSINQIRR